MLKHSVRGLPGLFNRQLRIAPAPHVLHLSASTRLGGSRSLYPSLIHLQLMPLDLD